MNRKHHPTEPERFAALGALLAAPGSSWSEVMTTLAFWPPQHRPDDAIAAVEAVADRWHPSQRGLARAMFQQLLAGTVSPALRLVRSLDLLAFWRLRDDGRFERMLTEGGITRLHTLLTRYHYDDLATLLTRHVTGLQVLQIGSSTVGTRGAITLASSPSMAELVYLSLYGNNIDDEGAEALLASPYLGGLRHLNLYGNNLSPRMVERITAEPRWQGATIIIHGQR